MSCKGKLNVTVKYRKKMVGFAPIDYGIQFFILAVPCSISFLGGIMLILRKCYCRYFFH